MVQNKTATVLKPHVETPEEELLRLRKENAERQATIDAMNAEKAAALAAVGELEFGVTEYRPDNWVNPKTGKVVPKGSKGGSFYVKLGQSRIFPSSDMIEKIVADVQSDSSKLVEAYNRLRSKITR